MEFRVLGPIEVLAEQDPLVITSAVQRRLLTALLVQPNIVVPTARLIDILWGDTPPPSALKTLHAHLSRLRHALRTVGADVLETRAPGYVLRVLPDALDAHRFTDLHAVARTAAGQPQLALDRLTEALALWRGPAFAEFADEDFARAAAVHLDELRLVAIEDHVDAALALGRHSQLVAELEAFLAEHPLRERVWAQLMLALYRCGRHAEALNTYQRFRRLLTEELGLEPSFELVELERDILRQDPRLGLRAPVPDNLPVRATSFVGRDGETAVVAAAVRHSPVVTLTGVGGVGKTSLAVQVAAAARDDYPDGVWYCELGALREPGAVAHALVTALGVVTSAGSVDDSLVDFLVGRRLLLVVDNCEHVLEAVAPLVARINGQCRGVRVLATSRERLGIDGERLWPVEPLPVPPPDEGISQIQQVASVRLFCDRASAVDPGFVLTSQVTPAVVEICRRLDGLPLAIELAAARAQAMTPADIAVRLGERFRLLGDARRGGAARHRTLAALIDWSYGLLAEAERRVFDRLSAFAGGCTLIAAEQVCAGAGVEEDEVAGLVADLVTKSMVTIDRSGPSARYVLLETLRAYGRGRLVERGESDVVRRRHAEYFVAFAEQAEVGLQSSEEARWVELVEQEFDNLRAASECALDCVDVDLGLRLVVALYEFARHRLRFEVFAWAERMVELPGAAARPLYPRACRSAAAGPENRGNLTKATELGEAGLAMAGGPDDLARVLLHQLYGLVALYQGRLDEARGHAEEMRRVAHARADSHYARYAQALLTLSLAYLGDTAAAIAISEDALRDARALGNPSEIATALYVRGEALAGDDPIRALALLDEAILVARSVRNRFIEGVTLVSVTTLRGRHGRPREALDAFGEVIEHWRVAGDWTHQWVTLRNLLELFARLELDRSAAVLYGAVTTATTGARAYGADAARLAELARLLRGRLGAEEWQSAVGKGAAMADEQVVAFAGAQITCAIVHEPV